MEFREDINRTYDCMFYPPMKGHYKVSKAGTTSADGTAFVVVQKIIVTFNEQEVPHSPFLISVDAAEPTPESPLHDNVDSPLDVTTREWTFFFPVHLYVGVPLHNSSEQRTATLRKRHGNERHALRPSGRTRNSNHQSRRRQ